MPSLANSRLMPCPPNAPGAGLVPTCRWRDDCAPEAPFAAAFASHKADLLARLAAGQTLAIHCRGGSGRTGLMAAILLLGSGYPPAEVKALVQGCVPGADPDPTSTTSTPTTHSPVKGKQHDYQGWYQRFWPHGPSLASRRLRLGGCGVCAHQ